MTQSTVSDSHVQVVEGKAASSTLYAFNYNESGKFVVAKGKTQGRPHRRCSLMMMIRAAERGHCGIRGDRPDEDQARQVHGPAGCGPARPLLRSLDLL